MRRLKHIYGSLTSFRLICHKHDYITNCLKQKLNLYCIDIISLRVVFVDSWIEYVHTIIVGACVGYY